MTMLDTWMSMVLLTVMRGVCHCTATYSLQNSSHVTVYPGSITELDNSTTFINLGHLAIHTGATLTTAPGTELLLTNVSLDIGGGHTSMADNSSLHLVFSNDGEFDGTVSLGVNSSLTANQNATLSIIGQSMLSMGTNAQAFLHDFCTTIVDTQSNLIIGDGATFSLNRNASIIARQQSLLSIQGQPNPFSISGGAVTLVNSKLTISNCFCISKDSTIQLQDSVLNLQANAQLRLTQSNLVLQASSIHLGEQSRIQQIQFGSLNVNNAAMTFGDESTFTNLGSVNVYANVTIDDSAGLYIDTGGALVVRGSIHVQRGASLFVDSQYSCTVIGTVTVLSGQHADLCDFPQSIAPCIGCLLPRPTITTSTKHGSNTAHVVAALGLVLGTVMCSFSS